MEIDSVKVRLGCNCNFQLQLFPALSIDNRELVSHAPGVYPTLSTSRIGTAKVKLEEET